MTENQVESLRDVFKCIICMEKLQDARLCPHCSKLACYGCIRRWLTEQRSQCPHCRSNVRLCDLINCRWAEEVNERIDQLHANAGASETSLHIDRCERHQEKLSVYCWTCQTCICHHCALWCGQHAGHALKPLQDEYKARVGRIKSEVKKLRRRLCDLVNMLKDLDSNVEAVRRSKEERVREIRCAVELIIARLDSSMKNKLISLTTQKQSLSVEVEMVENAVRQVEESLANDSQANLIMQSDVLLGLLNESQHTCQSSLTPVAADFVSEIIPPYDCHVFVLQNFTELRAKADPVYSTPLLAQGMQWRLKVYPDGNGVVRGHYLSVFLELTNGPSGTAKYEYRIDMLHQTGDTPRNIVREFASDFEVGECWGYNRFFKLNLLANEGFLNEADDSLVLQFQVRAPTYYQKCKDYLWYMNALEAMNLEQKREIEQLKNVASNGGQKTNEHNKQLYRDETVLGGLEVNGETQEFSSVQIDVSDSADCDNGEQHPWDFNVVNAAEHFSSPRPMVVFEGDLLPGEVPRVLFETPDGLAATERDVDEETTSNDNDMENLSLLLNAMNVLSPDFSVPDRESPPSDARADALGRRGGRRASDGERFANASRAVNSNSSAVPKSNNVTRIFHVAQNLEGRPEIESTPSTSNNSENRLMPTPFCNHDTCTSCNRSKRILYRISQPKTSEPHTRRTSVFSIPTDSIHESASSTTDDDSEHETVAKSSATVSNARTAKKQK